MPKLPPCMLLQSFGVSHMKFAAEFELRSLIRVQSVVVQVAFRLGFARTMFWHRVELLTMSEKETNGLCSCS